MVTILFTYNLFFDKPNAEINDALNDEVKRKEKTIDSLTQSLERLSKAVDTLNKKISVEKSQSELEKEATNSKIIESVNKAKLFIQTKLFDEKEYRKIRDELLELYAIKGLEDSQNQALIGAIRGINEEYLHHSILKTHRADPAEAIGILEKLRQVPYLTSSQKALIQARIAEIDSVSR